jgi:hypothetical protein
MSNVVPIHSEPDAVVNLIGDLHMESGALVVGDVDVARKLAATAGVLNGGRQFGLLKCVFTKITVDVTTSDQSFGGAFYEASEPTEAKG